MLHAEADVYHMHPPLTHNYGADSKLWDPLGDGIVAAGPVIIDDAGQPQAQVLAVEAAVASAGGSGEQTEIQTRLDRHAARAVGSAPRAISLPRVEDRRAY